VAAADLNAESACGLQTVDLNHDDYPDLVVHNHVKDASTPLEATFTGTVHGALIRNRRTELPTFGPHLSQMIDPGNLYTRKLEEEYVSAAITLPADAGNLRLAWKAEEPRGTKLQMQVRCAVSKEGLAGARRTGPAGEGTAFQTDPASLTLPLEAAGFMQYRALFTSVDGGEWPVLTEVEILRQ